MCADVQSLCGLCYRGAVIVLDGYLHADEGAALAVIGDVLGMQAELAQQQRQHQEQLQLKQQQQELQQQEQQNVAQPGQEGEQQQEQEGEQQQDQEGEQLQREPQSEEDQRKGTACVQFVCVRCVGGL
jgi:hypothetical protein